MDFLSPHLLGFTLPSYSGCGPLNLPIRFHNAGEFARDVHWNVIVNAQPIKRARGLLVGDGGLVMPG